MSKPRIYADGKEWRCDGEYATAVGKTPQAAFRLCVEKDLMRARLALAAQDVLLQMAVLRVFSGAPGASAP